jgi:hypothetical protein
MPKTITPWMKSIKPCEAWLDRSSGKWQVEDLQTEQTIGVFDHEGDAQKFAEEMTAEGQKLVIQNAHA